MVVTKQTLLAEWVKLKHAGQVKKYTGEPYYNHLAAVAALAGPATMLGYEIGLCHDLSEDTGTDAQELFEKLLYFDYSDMEANYITKRVVELTDVFTATAFPQLSRTTRKEKEAERLSNISAGAQTVKYADLIDNMPRVIRHDKVNAGQYLEKKKRLLLAMTDGEKQLRNKALLITDDGL
jgi:(p)ppGpp synthase/HD superfamily hydrolase